MVKSIINSSKLISVLADIYILRKHEREKHLDTLKAAVRLIIYTLLLTPEGEVLRNESWGVDKLCYSIEQIFSHGFIGLSLFIPSLLYL